MICQTINLKEEPHWSKGYFKAFYHWKQNEAPKQLPEGYSDWLTLFYEQNNIAPFTVESDSSKNNSKFVGMKYCWRNEQEKVIFILRFS